MDDLARLITDVAVAVAATALAHMGVPADDVELRSSKAQNERIIKRSRTPDHLYAAPRPAA